MTVCAQIAKQFREVYSGGNWTSVNFKDTLADVDWKQATMKVQSFNTIASLVFHTNYYVVAILNVLKGKPIEAHDKYSFDLPPIESQKDWNGLLEKTWKDAEEFASIVDKLPDSKLSDVFVMEKYGNYYRNLHGVIQHNHYHLGQMVIIKKLLLNQ
jgi:uncharacterized damage-inducible protein DinB